MATSIKSQPKRDFLIKSRLHTAAGHFANEHVLLRIACVSFLIHFISPFRAKSLALTFCRYFQLAQNTSKPDNLQESRGQFLMSPTLPIFLQVAKKEEEKNSLQRYSAEVLQFRFSNNYV